MPNALIVWAAVSARRAVFLLTRTTLRPRRLRHRQPRARGLSLRRRHARVVMIAFALCGRPPAFGGVLLAGYRSKAAQAMGDAYLLPAIAAVVLRRHLDPRRPRHLSRHRRRRDPDHAAQHVLSVMQMPEAGRQYLWRRHRRDAAALRPRRAGDELSRDPTAQVFH